MESFKGPSPKPSFAASQSISVMRLYEAPALEPWSPSRRIEADDVDDSVSHEPSTDTLPPSPHSVTSVFPDTCFDVSPKSVFANLDTTSRLACKRRENLAAELQKAEHDLKASACHEQCAIPPSKSSVLREARAIEKELRGWTAPAARGDAASGDAEVTPVEFCQPAQLPATPPRRRPSLVKRVSSFVQRSR